MDKFRILLVDDERDYINTLAERLEMRNQNVTVAYSGEEALEFISRNKPDVVLLDLRMPGMDGIEVLKEIKINHPDIEVVILSGKGTASDKAEAKILQAFEYLEKPADLEQIIDTAKRAHLSKFQKIMVAAAFAQSGDADTAKKIMDGE